MSSRIRSDFGTIAERAARMRNTPDPTVSIPPPDSTATPGQHWVLLDGIEEALLAKWRHAGNGTWEGLVARVGGSDDLWAEWIPAARLTPHTQPGAPSVRG